MSSVDMFIGLSDYEENSQLETFMDDSEDDVDIFPELLETNDKGALELKFLSLTGSQPTVY